MKKMIILALVTTALQLDCMKRMRPTFTKEEFIKETHGQDDKNVEYLSVLSIAHQKTIVFDSFMFIQKFDQIISPVEAEQLKNDFLYSKTSFHPLAPLLQRYHDIIMSDLRVPRKVECEGCITFI